jgi:integrase
MTTPHNAYDHDQPRDYVDSDPNAAPDPDDAAAVVPIPAGADYVGTWRYALPLFIQSGDFSAATRKQYDWHVRQFFKHPRIGALRLNEINRELLQVFRQYLFERTQPGFRLQDTPAAAAAAAGQTTALVLWAPGVRGRKSERGPGALSVASVNVMLTALRSFLQFCRKRGWLADGIDHDTIDDLLPGLTVAPSAPQDILYEHEWAGFVAAAAAPLRGDGSGIKTKAGNTGAWTAKRDAAIVTVLQVTACRRSELVNLNVGNFARVPLPNGAPEWRLTLEAHQTKGGYGAGSLPVDPDVIAVLSDYLQATGRTWRDRASPLFLSTRPSSGGGTGRLGAHTLNIIVGRVREQWIADRRAAGDELESRNIHPHSTRASAAVALMQGNPAKGRRKAGLHDTQRFLRHSNPNTTDRYLRGLDAGEQLRPFALSIGEQPAPPTTPEPGEPEPGEPEPGV